MVDKKTGLKRSITQVIIFMVLMLLILASVFFFLFSYRQLNRNIEKERTDYVSEISQQLRSNISSARSTNLRIASFLSDTMSYVQPDSFESCYALFHNYLKDGGSSLFFVDADGMVLSINGSTEGVDNRGYISQVLNTGQYSAFEKIGREEEYWLFSSMLSRSCMVEDHEIKAVILAWDKETYSADMTISIFGGLGYSFLIAPNGAVTVATDSVDEGDIGFNILSTLEEQGIQSSIYEEIKKNLENGEDNSIVCELSGIQWLLQYNKLEEGSFTFIMVPLALTAAGTYSGMTTTMLAVLAVFASLSLLVIYVILNSTRKEKQRQKEVYEINLARQAVEAKNDFLAKMSHDIRTPLNGIIGMNYIASTQIDPQNKEALESLGKIETSSKYLLSIINDILDMSKIESGNMQISNRPFFMQEVLQNVKNMLEITAAQKHLEFETVFEINSDACYMGDVLRINQVVMNLLSNAFKFTEKGKVGFHVISRRKDDRFDEIVIRITDTGMGMSREYLEKIFTPFLQESAEIAENYGGSGLGLSIVKNLVDLMGGSLSVESEKGEGTEFTVILSLERTKEGGCREKAEIKQDTDCLLGKRVLVAEDNELNGEIIIEILKMKGLETEWAKNGKEAWEKFEASEAGYYSLVLMDIHMPEMDGLLAAERIRASKHPDAESIPICAMSANAFEEDVLASKAAGMNEHLKKPVEIQKLDAALRRYIK